MGRLIKRDTPEGEAKLKTLLLDNLGRLHANEGWPYKGLHSLIPGLYETLFAYNRYNNNGTTGAFANFGPGNSGICTLT